MMLLFGTFFSEGTALGGLGFSDGRSVRELHETVSPPMEMIDSELATSARRRPFMNGLDHRVIAYC